MFDKIGIQDWPEIIRQRYEDYLKTSFFFSDPGLRDSFQRALREDGNLLQGGFPEPHSKFEQGVEAHELAKKYFPGEAEDLLPALFKGHLYAHQQTAIRTTHVDGKNVFVATGTASGKTESFLYPILFELYRQHCAGTLKEPGVRAMILYPMNALANDQRERLGKIREQLNEVGSGFEPTFGQYTGQTPKHERDESRNAAIRDEESYPGEIVFRHEMWENPPHILLTNYSMLEYLLIRPEDSSLFDDGRGKYWQFLVLDEAHQYRGAKGMEMGMLIRRLKQRLRDGGRQDRFQCIATSATISRKKDEDDEKAVATFAKELFGENFDPSQVIFGKTQKFDNDESIRRYHAFLRALEGAFLVHKEGRDSIVLNRKREVENENVEPLEVALCRECGQHYYVGKNRNGKLQESVRDPSQPEFGVEYYLPTESGNDLLCRRCGVFSKQTPKCDCKSSIPVKKCLSSKDYPDRLKECEVCGYRGVDPVQEIVHGSNATNSVIVAALHELLPEDKRKVLAFVDSRQEAAYFAWYAEDSYDKLRDRNFLFRVIDSGSSDVTEEGLSIEDLQGLLLRHWEEAELFGKADTKQTKNRKVLTSILREAVTDEKRLSLSGVGLVKWFVAIPQSLILPHIMRKPPWNFTEKESHALIEYLLDGMRLQRALNLPEGSGTPQWGEISRFPLQAFSKGPPQSRSNIKQWGGPKSSTIKYFLYRLLEHSDMPDNQKWSAAKELMEKIWDALMRDYPDDSVLASAKDNGTFCLDSCWLRIKPVRDYKEIWECATCATISSYNIRNICPRDRCSGVLRAPDRRRLESNHYRKIYQVAGLPSKLSAKEHTAQISNEEARKRQNEFKDGNIHLLSSSTTFEVGVDLGNLDSVFLRNVPPEPFNYTQRAGRAGRRDESTGLVLTYCRRNPHDLYHYNDPKTRILKGEIHPPRLHMTNEKIILRHMVAVALSSFFKKYESRFKNVEEFIGDWKNPQGVSDLRNFCEEDKSLKESLYCIVPEDMHDIIGISDDSWIEKITGKDSRLEEVQAEVCTDYAKMKELIKQYTEQEEFGRAARIKKHEKTISEEKTLTFLSRKAVIPKYGFPVDVVELDVHPTDNRPTNVVLQRDLSQAIAEYAPGSTVIANKLEWKAYGLKMIEGKEWPERYYHYNEARDFQKSLEPIKGQHKKMKYLIPKFGFVTSLFEKPSEPRKQSQRLYTTRPFFVGFRENLKPKSSETPFGIKVTKATPGTLVILCEGKNKAGFFICYSCGAQMVDKNRAHKSPWGSKCAGTLGHFSLGHELDTDVVRLQFKDLRDEWDAYSVAYAVLLGAADTLEVLNTDLNVTITQGIQSDESAVVLYDNVPGGAGLVAQLEKEEVLREILDSAKKRVEGVCGCDSSCYGCLRSYRNQFAHPYLDRKVAGEFLK